MKGMCIYIYIYIYVLIYIYIYMLIHIYIYIYVNCCLLCKDIHPFTLLRNPFTYRYYVIPLLMISRGSF